MTIQPIQRAQGGEVEVWSRRSDGVTLVAVYHFVVAALFLVGTLIMSIPTLILGIVTLAEEPDAVIGFVAMGFIAAVLLALSLVNLAVGYGLWRVQTWGRTGAIVLAIIGLLFFPIGTITGAVILWYLLKPEVAAHFE
ncbi:MAG: hypothetical protein DCC55_05890 [Chloroflexi bacterium]|nr:MAG: hypothetical protein DCC55_05890 [Chloroflexota bacterium]